MTRRRAMAAGSAVIIAGTVWLVAQAPVDSAGVTDLSACVGERLGAIAVVPEASFDPDPDLVAAPATGSAIRLRDGGWISFIRLGDEEMAAQTRARILADRRDAERAAAVERRGTLVVIYADEPSDPERTQVADCGG